MQNLRHSLRGSVDWNLILSPSTLSVTVTPFAGVWIEISKQCLYASSRLSLPSRECGLKFLPGMRIFLRILSLPSRECGLKWKWNCSDWNYYSHSLRGSVDWNLRAGFAEHIRAVTPFAGVWIEIEAKPELICVQCVTPFAGVWIEISWMSSNDIWPLSLPSRECGLKYSPDALSHMTALVTPFAGVWIEMSIVGVYKSHESSLPSRECGLKFPASCPFHRPLLSLPSRECGLKSALHRENISFSTSLPSRECGLK